MRGSKHSRHWSSFAECEAKRGYARNKRLLGNIAWMIHCIYIYLVCSLDTQEKVLPSNRTSSNLGSCTDSIVRCRKLRVSSVGDILTSGLDAPESLDSQNVRMAAPILARTSVRWNSCKGSSIRADDHLTLLLALIDRTLDPERSRCQLQGTMSTVS